MTTEFLKVKNRAKSTLAATISAAAVSLDVAAGEGALFPSAYPFHITIGDEIMSCTNRATDTLTVTREQQGTTAAIHNIGVNVRLNVTAKHISDLNTFANTHEVDLDAHTYNFYDIYRTGEYIPRVPVGSNSITTSLIADYLYVSLFVVARDITIDRLAIQVTTLEAGKSCYLGIYSNGTNMYPGTLLQDYGTVSVAATGVVAASADQALTKGLYWLAILSNNAGTLRVRGTSYAVSSFALSSTAFETMRNGWYKGQAYGALPATFPAGGSLGTNTQGIFPRIKSLD